MIQTVKTKIKMKRKDKEGNPVYKEVEKYRFRVYYTCATGERRRKESRLYDTKKLAEKAEIDFLADNKMQVTSSGIKFNDLYIMYRTDSSSNVEESTFITKFNKIDKHILPFFKDIYIDDITPLTIRKWQKQMLEKKYSRSYLMNMHMYLSSIIEYGVKYYGLRTNPAKVQGNFKIKKVPTKEAEKENFYTYEEFKRFITKVPDTYKLFFMFLYFSGCRFGEAIALSWNDYDGKSVKVNYSITRKTKDGPYKKKMPKNIGSIRTIDLPDQINVKLNELKESEKKKECFDESWFIFGGIRPLADTTVRRVANKAMKNARLKHITLHGFRHSHASLLINGGMNIKLISTRLGHTDVAETLNTYTHMFPEQRDICVDYLNKLL